MGRTFFGVFMLAVALSAVACTVVAPTAPLVTQAKEKTSEELPEMFDPVQRKKLLDMTLQERFRGRNLALQGKYAEAEAVFQRGLALRTKLLGPEHSGIAPDLNEVAGILQSQGRYLDAELLYRRGLAICERDLTEDPKDPFRVHYFAGALSNLATNLVHQGRYTEAEQLLKRAVAGQEQATREIEAMARVAKAELARRKPTPKDAALAQQYDLGAVWK